MHPLFDRQRHAPFLKAPFLKPSYNKTCLKQPLKMRPKFYFQNWQSLNVGQKYSKMLQRSILQYFWPALSYHLSLRPLFFLFLSGHLRQVLLYLIQLAKIYIWLPVLGSTSAHLYFVMSIFCRTQLFLSTLVMLARSCGSGWSNHIIITINSVKIQKY